MCEKKIVFGVPFLCLEIMSAAKQIKSFILTYFWRSAINRIIVNIAKKY